MVETSHKKKVLYCVTKGNLGGAQHYVFDLATNLPKDLSEDLAFEVVVALGEGEALEKKLAEKNIRTVRLKNSQRNINPLKDLFLFFELLNLFKRERPDIIHLNSSKIGFLGALAARIHYTLHPTPYTLIFTAHGWAFNDSKFSLLKIFWKFLQWLTVLLADKTIAVSEKTKKDLAHWPFMSKKIQVIYNGINEIEFLNREEAREKLSPQKKNGFWIGTISELHKNKGLDIFIESFSELIKKNQKIFGFIIGSGEEKAHLSSLIRKKGLQNNVFLLGYVENASQFLKAFDVFTLTSKTEGLPYVLLEAGSAELAVVASKVGGIPEILSEKEETGILIEENQPEYFSEKIKYLINNPEKRQQFARNLKKRTEDKFSLDNMARETILIYNL